jgi:hypothetical protein
MHELFLLEIEKVKPLVLCSHPQHAAPIPIDRENGVTVETIRVAVVVLKPVRETLCSPVKMIETPARWHP